MRVLGVDFGGARIGLAVMETSVGIATARPALASAGSLAKDAKGVAAAARKEGVDRVVLGVPLSEGEETRMSGVCRKLGALIEGEGVPVSYVDEALTSAEAEREMMAAGLKGSERRKRVDGEAAARILERYLVEQA